MERRTVLATFIAAIVAPKVVAEAATLPVGLSILASSDPAIRQVILDHNRRAK